MKNKNIALLALALLVLGSCSKSDVEPASVQQRENANALGQATPFSLSLEGDLDSDLPQDDDEARAFAFDVKPTGPELKMTEESIPSVAVIANADKSIVYYININWSKTPGRNHLYFKDVEVSTDLFGKPVNLTANQRWYIMGYLGGEFNRATQDVVYNPNGTGLTASGDQPTVKNVPVAFPWAELEVKHYGQKQLALAKEKIRFRTLGMMMRLTLKNDFSSAVRVKSIKYQTNVLTTTAGRYKLNTGNLPATTATTLPSWVSDGNSTAEPTYGLANTDGTAVDLAAGATSTQSFLVWGMPVATKPTAPMTHVIANVSRLNGATEETYPKMSTLYVWGSTNMPKERSRRKISALVEREKMALEYFAKDYAGPNRLNVLNQATAENTSSAGIPLFSYAEASKANALRTGWRVPYYKDARGLYIVDLIGDNVQFTGSTTKTLSDIDIRVNGVEKKYTDIFRNGSTVYALRFDGDSRKIYSAWRYNFSVAGGATIEAVYLGPNYKGGINDIAQASFWTLHANDIIKRSYSTSSYTINGGQETRSNIAHFWALSESVPDLSNPTGYRRWTIGLNRTTGIAELSHVRHASRGVDIPSNSHIIPMEAVETVPTWHD